MAEKFPSFDELASACGIASGDEWADCVNGLLQGGAGRLTDGGEAIVLKVSVVEQAMAVLLKKSSMLLGSEGKDAIEDAASASGLRALWLGDGPNEVLELRKA